MTDVFKKEYKKLSDDSSKKITEMKDAAEKLLSYMDINSREMSVAKTYLESAVMWGTKALVIHDELPK